MTDREKLLDLINQALLVMKPKFTFEALADYLLDYGVIVPPCKPIGVMSDGNKFNTDVYCPCCGENLSGFYGDEPTKIIQCFVCGNFLDNTKILSREEAKKAIAERAGNK